jgi:microcin C transport system ATP-binding protein
MSPGENADTPLLRVQNLGVAFGPKAVVKDLSYTLAPGEKLAIVGESGSGKTLSALALLGLADGAAVSGHAWWAPGRAGQSANAAPVDLLALPERALRGIRGDDIAMVFQEPMTALNPLLTVGAQIAEVVQLKRGLARRAAWQRAIALLRETGIPQPEQRAQAYPHQLSGGQRQRAMIAMALACEPKLLLADEPTTALDVNLRAQILQLMARLQAEQGMAMVIITHDLNLVRRFADNVLVMQNGKMVEYGAVSDVFASPANEYTIKLLDSRPERRLPPAPAQPGDAPLVQAQGLCVRYPRPRPGISGWFGKDWFVAVDDVNFTLPRGHTLGVIGESGSGKSTLAQAVLGLLPFDGGLSVEGRHWQRSERANQPLRRIAQVVFQDPFSSLSPRMMVEELVGEGLIVHEPGLGAPERAQRVRAVLAEVGLSEAQFPGLLQRYPHEFSGGQRQRLAIARALIVQPELLVLDEPTSALDVTVQKQVLSLLQRLQQQRGLSYILITHDVAVVGAMAHEVMVMKDGKTVEYGDVDVVLETPTHPYTQALILESQL